MIGATLRSDDSRQERTQTCSEDIRMSGMNVSTTYLDHAATTPMDPVVFDAMRPFFLESYGNPSSLHGVGRSAREALDGARKRVAAVLGCRTDEVVFCGGGTESDNAAVFGAVYGAGRSLDAVHVVTTAIEHEAVLEACREVERRGVAVTYLPVDRDGRVDPAQLRAAIRPETVLVSVMYANNEIGTIEPIVELIALLRAVNVERAGVGMTRIAFHSDACQAAGALDCRTDVLGVDLMTLNGSKIYGPKGVGILYVRKGTPLRPLIYGGAQEFDLRSGTENIPGIVGFATALDLAERHRAEEAERLRELRDRAITDILQHIPTATLNGHPTDRLPNNVNICLGRGVDANAVLLMLDARGFAIGTKSACSEKQGASHVLEAIGVGPECQQSSIRLTFGRTTTREHVTAVVTALVDVVTTLRARAPMKEV